MPSLARRNLFHDKVRLAVTLTGIVFAVVLITVQLGLFVGFANTTSNIIDHSGADLWIAAKGLRNFDQAAPFSERKYFQAMGVSGVTVTPDNRTLDFADRIVHIEDGKISETDPARTATANCASLSGEPTALRAVQ